MGGPIICHLQSTVYDDGGVYLIDWYSGSKGRDSEMATDVEVDDDVDVIVRVMVFV
jgi:hypothetical protein